MLTSHSRSPTASMSVSNGRSRTSGSSANTAAMPVPTSMSTPNGVPSAAHSAKRARGNAEQMTSRPGVSSSSAGSAGSAALAAGAGRSGGGELCPDATAGTAPPAAPMANDVMRQMRTSMPSRDTTRTIRDPRSMAWARAYACAATGPRIGVAGRTPRHDPSVISSSIAPRRRPRGRSSTPSSVARGCGT